MAKNNPLNEESQLNKNNFTKTLPFVLLPLVLFIFSQILVDVKGPFYLGWNSDPEYAYLLNSVNLLHLHLPGHYDHPGTPMQEYGAVIILLRYFFVHVFNGVQSMHLDVLANPEAYLRWINSSLIVFLGASLYFSGRMVYKHSKNLFLALLTQSIPFLYSSLLLSTSRVTPEPLMMVCVSLISTLFISEYYQSVPFRSRKSGMMLGALIGFGIASKVTLIPLALLVFLPAKIKTKVISVISAAVSFLIFTIPIFPLYLKMLDWLKDLLIHMGIYGGGEVGLPGFGQLIKNLFLLLQSEPQYFLMIVFLALVSVQLHHRKRSHTGFLQKSFFILFLIFFFQALITIKHPSAHYMLPSMMLSTILPVLFWNFLKKNKDLRSRLFKGFVIFSLICSFLITSKEVKRIVDYNISAEKTQNLIHEEYSDCIIANYYRSSSQAYALSYGNDYANLNYRDALHNVYPDAVAYEKWGQYFHQFGNRFNFPEIQLQLENGSCWLMRGSPMTEEQINSLPVNLIRLDENNSEALYLLTSVK